MLTCATTRKIKNLKTPLGEIVFHHLHPRLFHNFENDKGILRATAEKALLDFLYISSRSRKYFPPLDEFDLDRLDRKKLKKLAEDFPKSIRERLIRSKHLEFDSNDNCPAP